MLQASRGKYLYNPIQQEARAEIRMSIGKPKAGG